MFNILCGGHGGGIFCESLIRLKPKRVKIIENNKYLLNSEVAEHRGFESSDFLPSNGRINSVENFLSRN